MPDGRGRPEPLDPPMVPFMLAGTGAWAVIGLVLLATDAPRDWLWTCLAGLVTGLAMLPLMLIRDRRSRTRHSRAHGSKDHRSRDRRRPATPDPTG